MRTSDRILRQVRRALVAAFLLAGLASLLLAALALHAIPLLSDNFSAPDAETLGLLAASAAACGLVLLCLAAARERILQRAGLWLDHTLAHHLLLAAARRGMPADALRGDAAAIARLRDALLERRIAPLLQAPWAMLGLAALALLQPLLAALCALAAVILLLASIGQAHTVARLEKQRLRAGERVAAWWRGLPSAPLSGEATRDWERLNRTHIAAAYALDRRVLRLRDVARVVQAASLLAATGVGAWLAMHGQLTAGALATCLLLHMQVLGPCARLLAHVQSTRRALLDYRRLATPASERRPAHAVYPALDAQHMPLPTFTAPVPRLHIGGPRGLALGAGALLMAFAGATATVIPPQSIAALAGDVRPSHAVQVRHAKGGVAARVHVVRGVEVKAGDVLVTLDTTALDRRIASLRSDAEAARKVLDTVTYEAAAIASATPPTPADRARLRVLDEQIADLQQRADALPGRISMAELELARSVIRAPVTGRLVALGVRAPNDTIAAGAVVAEIVPLSAATDAQASLFDRLAEPLLRTMHRVLRSLTQENAA